MHQLVSLMETLITSPGINEILFQVNGTNLQLVQALFTDLIANASQATFNTLCSFKDNAVLFTVFDIYLFDMTTANIIQYSTSQDFTYYRFLEFSHRAVSSIVSSNVSNTDIFYITRNTCDLNEYGYTSWLHAWHMLYICIHNHLPWFIPLFYIIMQCSFTNMSCIPMLTNKFSLYLFLLVLQARPVFATNMELANNIIAGLGWFFYINLMACYDIIFKNIKYNNLSETLFRRGNVNFRFLGKKLFLGILFLFVVNMGVLFSNSFYNSTTSSFNTKSSIIAIIVSLIISTLASSGWLSFTRRDMLKYNWLAIRWSYIRSLCESFAFNALSYANYIIWSFLPQTVAVYSLTFVIGLICYILFSYFQIRFETDLDHVYIYGLLYNIVFTSLSMSSSGLFFLIKFISMNLWLKTVLMIICFINVICLPLEVYRFKSDVRLGEQNTGGFVEYLVKKGFNRFVVIYIIAMLHQLVLFFSFAIGTFIWLDLAGLTL